ncbi:phosphotransferase family protein [Streptomyces sp. NPDC057011]|uniref:phosphotransferase family protein n=1 Tax=unclassified Streptomyces TaxID=2593676 RepID=UPI00364049AF
MESHSAPETAPPPAAGVRTEWWAVPDRVRGLVEEGLGARVERAVTQSGGFSPGVAARVRLTDGRRVFLKAAGPQPNPDTPGLHRAEARITSALPTAAPVPSLLMTWDVDGWAVLAFEDIDGSTPAQPWLSDELRRVLAATAELAALLDPAPVDVPSLADRCASQFRGWRHLAAAADAGPVPALDPWARRNLARLAERERGWERACAGTALVHGDLRADNLLLTDDRVVVVDWPWAAVGAAWFDVVAMAPSVIMQSGPGAVELIDAHLDGRGAPAQDVTTVLTAVAGYFAHQSLQAPPSGLPTLRAFQRAQGEAALGWLRRRTGWS